MSATLAAAILLPVAEKVGATVIKAILAKAGVKGFDGAVDSVVKSVAEAAGVRPDELGAAPDLADAVQEVETQATMSPELMAAYVDSQRLSIDLQRAEIAAEPSWTWAWRPAWMYLLAMIWLYALMLRPMVNAAVGAAIEPVDLSILMTLTGFYLSLYMGGHTIKDGLGKWMARPTP